MPRERRQRLQPNAALYVGYADDDEDIGSIMAKFARLEKASNAAAAKAGANNGGNGGDGDANGGDANGGGGGGSDSPPKLSEEELLRAVGGGPRGVDFSMESRPDNGSQRSGHRLRPKGELVVTGTVSLVEANVRPEELDVADADDAFARLAAGRDYAPPAQQRRQGSNTTTTTTSNDDDDSNNDVDNDENNLSSEAGAAAGDADASDPAAPAAEPIRAGKDVVMVELKGIDAYTRERIIEGLPTSSVSPQRKEIFLGKIMQAMRLSAVEGKPVGLDVAAKTLHEADGLEGWMRKAAATLMRMCAKDPVEFRARSKGVGLICIRPDGIPKGGRHAHARVFITTPRVTEPPSHLDIVVHRQ